MLPNFLKQNDKPSLKSNTINEYEKKYFIRRLPLMVKIQIKFVQQTIAIILYRGRIVPTIVTDIILLFEDSKI